MPSNLIPSQNPALFRRHALSCENPEDLDVLFAAYVDAFRPANPVEEDLIEEMAGSHWRMHRLGTVKRGLMQQARAELKTEMGPADFAAAQGDMLFARTLHEMNRHAKLLQFLAQYEAGLRREYKSSRNMFLEMRTGRPKPRRQKPLSSQAMALLDLPVPYFPRPKRTK
ncbi:MAG: hypothetical protein ABIZ80_06175 [Bryobacteraceae bacterium]